MRPRLPWLCSLWRIWAATCGVGVIALGLSFGLVTLVSTREPVAVHTEQKLLTPKIRFGEKLVYTLMADRKQGCKGDIIDLYSRAFPDRRTRIDQHRKLLSTEPGRYPLRIETDPPGTIMNLPGIWDYESNLESECPDGHHSDPVFKFQFEVVR